MQVKLSQKAQNRLTDIYEYYKEKGIGKYGRNVRANILKQAIRLKDFPKLGPIEKNMSEAEMEYRFLVEGNYKIINLIIDDLVFITDIFDTRQDPEKM